MKAQAGVKFARGLRGGLGWPILDRRRQLNRLHLHIEPCFRLLRNLLDAFRSHALRRAVLRGRAAGHVGCRAMHCRNHRGTRGGHRHHPYRNQSQSEQAQHAEVGAIVHKDDSNGPGDELK